LPLVGGLLSAQQFRQLRNVDRNPPRLVAWPPIDSRRAFGLKSLLTQIDSAPVPFWPGFLL
jgi:hypothetical protein